MGKMRNRPRLLFGEEDIEKIRLVSRSRNGKTFYEHSVRYCERYLDPDDPIYFDFRERRNEYWRTREGNFIVSGHLCALALMGWIADRREFLEAARDGFLTVIENRLADQVLGYTINPYLGWRGNNQHDAGKFAFTTAFLYDTLQSVSSPEQRERMRLYAAETLRIGGEHIRWARRTAPPHELTVPLDAMAFIDNNRDGRFLLGLCVLATCLENEPTFDPERAAALVKCGPPALSRCLRWSFGRDGEPFEGAGYGISALLFLLLSAQVFGRAGKADRRGDIRFARAADFLVHELVMQGNFFNNQNDCLPEVPAQILAWSGCRAGRKSAMWLWNAICCNPDSPSTLLGDRHATDFPSAPWALLWLNDDVDPKHPAEAGYPLDKHFRDRGLVSMRAGWSPVDLHCTIISARRGRTTHSQMDQNQVTLYGLGERFLIDIGYHLIDPHTGGQVSRHPRTGERIAVNTTVNHNLITIDGQGQFGRSTGVGWEEGRIESFASGTEYAFAIGDARECYGENGQILLAERQIFLSRRKGCAPYVILIDDIAVDDSRKRRDYVLRLHTDPVNRITGSDSLWHFLGGDAQLDLHIAGSHEMKIEEECFCDIIPRLAISMRSARARFVILLHPRREDGPEADFSVRVADEFIETAVRLNSGIQRFRFDTPWPPPELTTGGEMRLPEILG